MSNSTTPITEQLREAGASSLFRIFVKEFPESHPATHFRLCMNYDGEYKTGGGFCDALWIGDLELAYRYADLSNRARLERLLPEKTGILKRQMGIA